MTIDEANAITPVTLHAVVVIDPRLSLGERLWLWERLCGCQKRLNSR
jgi:hypothetical protein